MKLRRKRKTESPAIMLSPMIDMIFLLLVFFILSTMNMSEVKTIPIKLPVAQTAQSQIKQNFIVTIKKGGSLWLEDKLIKEEELVTIAKNNLAKDPKFTVMIRGEADATYEEVVHILDVFKKSGISRISLATGSSESKEK